MQVRLEAVTTEPITLAEVKEYLRVSHDAEDDLISELISSARERLEGFTGLSFVNREIIANYNSSNNWFELPYQPDASSIVLTDNEDDVISATFYEVRGLDYKQIYYISSTPFTVTYDAGFTTLPSGLKLAMKKQIATDYENRENFLVGDSATELSSSAQMLAQRFSRNSILGI
jgi:hypothetical protein